MAQFHNLLEMVQASKTNTVILGDFNEDLLAQEQQPIQQLMHKYDFYQQIKEPTTDYGSLLDHVYHNMNNVDAKYKVFDAFYTDHDLTTAAFKL